MSDAMYWSNKHDELMEAVERVADELAAERDRIRAAYREHNAGRPEGRPIRRPDLDTWANAYEVAERKVRTMLDVHRADA